MNNLKSVIGSFLNVIIFSKLFFRGKLRPGFNLTRDDLVIDIGCGDKPFWRADVFLDNTSLGDEQRFSSTGIEKNFGFFVDSDIVKTPFKDKTFDFSFCAHVLEHVERPDLAIKEIVRISRRGYIEVPDGLIEVMSPYQSHLWFVFYNNKELIFIRKSKKINQTLTGNGTKYSYLSKFIKDHSIRMYWKQNIKYKIVDDLGISEKYISMYDGRHDQPEYVQKTYLFLVNLMRLIFYKRKTLSILRDRL